MSDQELITALRRVAPETGSLRCLGCGHEYGCSLHGCLILRAAVDRLTELSAPPPNPPLTLEELRGMGEEWVWIELPVPLYRMDSGYYVKKAQFSTEDIFCCGYPHSLVMNLKYSGYGDGWVAYRRKPEEGRCEH